MCRCKDIPRSLVAGFHLACFPTVATGEGERFNKTRMIRRRIPEPVMIFRYAFAILPRCSLLPRRGSSCASHAVSMTASRIRGMQLSGDRWVAGNFPGDRVIFRFEFDCRAHPEFSRQIIAFFRALLDWEASWDFCVAPRQRMKIADGAAASKQEIRVFWKKCLHRGGCPCIVI